MNEEALKLTLSSSPHAHSPNSTRRIMLDVCIALLPALIGAIVFFGARALTLTALSVAGCVFFEWAYRRIMKKDNTTGDLSAVVTGILVAFVCPVTLPFWTILIGDFFAIVVVKQLFGGIGANIVNPALAARAFLFSWPLFMNTWVRSGVHVPAFSNPTTASLDGLTAATPMASLHVGAMPEASVLDLFLGRTGGSLGEVSAMLLLLGGMDLFDASVHAFGAAGTGGFSSRNASIGAYNSAYIDIVTGIGMLAFGINFNLYYFLLMRRFRDVAKSEELWTYLGIVAFSTVTIAANIRHLYGAVGTSLRHAFFQVSSIITTTGYATVDFDQWPGYAKTVLVLLMFVGGCAGSTGGGLKVTRVVTLVKAAFMDMRKMIHPNAVVNVRMEGRAMPEKQVRGVQAYFSVYMLLYAVSWLLLSLNGFDLLSTFTALSACINNIGPGLGMVGPTGNFSAFAPWAKLLLSFDMLAGRLEIFPMLLLFVPSTWRGNRLRRWERRN